MDLAAAELLDLESESEEDIAVITLLTTKRRKSKQNVYLRKRSTHGEFLLCKEVPDKVFKGNFRLSMDEFKEIHELIKDDIFYQVGCNAQQAIGTEEKLIVCLR